MATPTPAQFQAFVTNVDTSIGAVYNEDMVDLVAPRISSALSCSSQQMVLGWTGLLRKMRIWYGPRVVQEAAPQTYTIIPVPFENTLGIDRFTLDDDQFGVLYRQLPDLARQARRQPDLETRDLIENAGGWTGTPQTGFYGISHWSTAIPVNFYNSKQGTYANDFTGGGFTPSSGMFSGKLVGGALSPAAFGTLRQYMMSILGEDNEVLGVSPNCMMVPTSLEITAKYILQAQMLAPATYGAYTTVGSQVGASDNILARFGVDLIVNKFLKDIGKWYLLDTTKSFKPFLWITREATRMVPRVNENDPSVFDSHTFLWGQWNRMAPAWGFPFLSARSGP